MTDMKYKLTSKSGASITYALLLFLVCAVVGSVVLAAGTAASGRISRSLESDQRYYSVTSAVKLMKEMIVDEPVEVIEKTTSVDGGEAENVEEYPKINGKTYSDSSSLRITEEAAAYFKKLISSSNSTVSREFTLTVGDMDSLKVKISETLDTSSGRITLVVTNDDEGAEESYSVTCIFDMDIQEKIDLDISKSMRTSGLSRTKTKTTTSTMTWSLTSMG